MKKRRVKLPGGRVMVHRADPFVKYLSHNESVTHSDVPTIRNAPVRPTASSVNTDGQVPPSHMLDESEVLIFGAGAMGGYLAYFLAAVARIIIHLIDFDVVDHKHTRGGRTIYEAGQVRQRKVYAAKDKIQRDYPLSRVIPYPYNVMDLPDAELRRLARRSSIVINAIDDGTAMLRINDLLYTETEILYAALHTGAASGHVILTAPLATACLRCCLNINSPDEIQTLHGEPGAGPDIRNVANHCVTIALEIMEAKVTGKPIERWDITRNIFYFSNRRDEQLSPEGPGVHLRRAVRMPGCPVCSAAH